MSDVTLHCGDCLEYMRGMPDDCVEIVIIDSPYLFTESEVTHQGLSVAPRIHDSKVVGMPWGYSLDWVAEVARLEPRHWFVFCVERMLSGLLPALERHAKLGTIFVWRKPNAPVSIRNVPRLDCEFVIWMKGAGATNGRAREFSSLVLDVPFPVAGCFATERVLRSDDKRAAHPTQKPLAIIRPFVERFTSPGDLVFDPFMGSGTTGVACVQTGRRFIGCEIDPGYYAIAQRRIADAQARPRLFDDVPTPTAQQQELLP